MACLKVVPFPLTAPPITHPFYIVGNNGHVVVANSEVLCITDGRDQGWRVYNTGKYCLENLSCINVSADGIIAMGTTKGSLEVLLPTGKSLSQRFDDGDVIIKRMIFAGNVVFALANNGNLCRWDLTTNEIRSLYYKHGILDIHYADTNIVYFAADKQIYKVVGPEFGIIEYLAIAHDLRHITSCNGLIYGADDNKVYQFQKNNPVFIASLGREKVIHLLPYFYSFFGIRLPVVLVITDTDKMHVLRSTSIICTFDIADLNMRFSEYQFAIEGSVRNFADEFDCAQSLAAYNEYVLFTSIGTKSIAAFKIPDAKLLVQELLNNEQIGSVFDLIAGSKIYVNENFSVRNSFKSAFDRCSYLTGEWLIKMNDCFSSIYQFYEFLTSWEQFDNYKPLIMDFMYENANMKELSAQVLFDLTKHYTDPKTRNLPKFENVVFNAPLFNLDLNLVSTILKRFDLVACRFYLGHFVELRSFLELQSLLDDAFDQEKYGDIVKVFEVMVQCWSLGVATEFHKCGNLTDKIHCIHWLKVNDIKLNESRFSVLAGVDESFVDLVLGFFGKNVNALLIHPMIEMLAMNLKTVTNKMLYKLWKLMSVADLVESFVLLFKAVLRKRIVKISSDLLLDIFSKCTDEMLEDLSSNLSEGNLHIRAAIGLVKNDVMMVAEAVKNFDDFSEESRSLLWLCLDYLCDQHIESSEGCEIFLKYFKHDAYFATEFAIKKLTIAYDWSINYENLERITNHGSFLNSFTSLALQEQTAFVNNLVGTGIDESVDDLSICRIFFKYPPMIAILMNSDNDMYIDNVEKYLLTRFFLKLDKKKTRFDDLVAALRVNDSSIIESVVDVLQKFDFSIGWVDVILGVILERVAAASEEEKIVLARIIQDLVYYAVTNGYHTDKIDRSFDMLDILVKNVLNGRQKYFADFDAVCMSFKELIKLQNREGKDIMARIIKTNGMML